MFLDNEARSLHGWNVGIFLDKAKSKATGYMKNCNITG